MEVRQEAAENRPAYFSDCSMDLRKDLCGHRLGDVNASDLGTE